MRNLKTSNSMAFPSKLCDGHVIQIRSFLTERDSIVLTVSNCLEKKSYNPIKSRRDLDWEMKQRREE